MAARIATACRACAVTALFEIKRKSGIDDDSDIDLHEEEGEGSMKLASAAGMARLAPNGLLKQTDRWTLPA